MSRVAKVCALALLLAGCGREPLSITSHGLPSWDRRSDNPADRIRSFVMAVTDPDNPAYIPPEDRIAVFDNDGTLWSERPVYFQLLFAVDRIEVLAPEHPQWKTTQPFKAALERDWETLAKHGEHGLLELVMATHAGMTTEAFEGVVRDWLATARHPRFDRPFTDLVYQPMLELLEYLRHHGFKTYIVSGGGIEFLRVWAEEVYGIPPVQVIGSSIKTKYEVRDGKPVIVRLPELDFVDDKAGKPVAINKHIGKRPVIAVGNSDGDFEMLEWTTAGEGARLGILVHHTDAEREWAYDRNSPVGRLDRGLDEASKRKWLMIDMKGDWRVVYPFELEER